MSKRGIRRVSMRVRLAVAAAVLVGGGAAAVVAVSANHGGTTAAESAGYYSSGQWMSYTSAMSQAMNQWGHSESASLQTISEMKPVTNYWTQSWHSKTIFIQRGIVVAVSKNEFAVKSADGQLEVWHANGGTAFLNVGGNKTGWNAMSGGSMSSYGSYDWSNSSKSNWDMSPKTLATGDLVFVFGERENHVLKAQLVLFAAPWSSSSSSSSYGSNDPAPNTPTDTSSSQFSGSHS
jgi:hypothetical protein